MIRILGWLALSGQQLSRREQPRQIAYAIRALLHAADTARPVRRR